MNFDAQKSVVLGVLEQKKGENFSFPFFFFFREKAESRGAVEKLSPDEAHSRTVSSKTNKSCFVRNDE